MTEQYAKMLAAHAADALRRTKRLQPLDLRILPVPAASADAEGAAPPPDELAVRIDFQGRLRDGTPLSGYVIAGLAGRQEMRPLLVAMAGLMGFEESLLDTPEGPIHLLNEFLNIVIGMAVAEWARQGLQTDFSPPRNVGGQARPAPDGSATAYRLQIVTDAAVPLHLLVVFNA
jgi:hypothetical protein